MRVAFRLAPRRIHGISAALESILHLPTRVLVLALADRAVCAAIRLSLFHFTAEPTIEDRRRDITPAAVVRHLDEMRWLQNAERGRVVSSLIETVGTDI